jgi:isocitrate dehydrogenase
VKEAEVGILQRARTPAEVMKILKRQARQAPKDRTAAPGPAKRYRKERALHAKSYEVTLIPGDGIGPEVAGGRGARAVRHRHRVRLAHGHGGAEAAGREGNPLPPAVLESITRTKIALKGPTATPIGTGHRSVNVALRKTLDLYANVRPVKTLPA